MAKVKEMVLNKFGTIEVTRGGKRSKLFCPYRKYRDPKTGRDECSFCGQECVLFSDPITSNGEVTIKVCRNEFTCDASNFKDERD